MKILIEVKNGAVVNVSCSQDADIVIVDLDCFRNGDENFTTEILKPDAICDDMHELFEDERDSDEMIIRDKLAEMKF